MTGTGGRRHTNCYYGYHTDTTGGEGEGARGGGDGGGWGGG